MHKLTVVTGGGREIRGRFTDFYHCLFRLLDNRFGCWSCFETRLFNRRFLVSGFKLFSYMTALLSITIIYFILFVNYCVLIIILNIFLIIHLILLIHRYFLSGLAIGDGIAAFKETERDYYDSSRTSQSV